MRIATIGFGALLLAGCGAGANNSQTQANGAVATPAPAPASAPDGGIVSAESANRVAPAPVPVDASAPIPGAPELSGPLVGRWGRLNSCAETMEFFADGRVNIPDGRGGSPTWRVPAPGRLELIENGRGQTGGFELRDNGRTLRLTNPNGRGIDFIRC